MTDTPLPQASPHQNPWGWAICASLLTHVGVLLLLAGFPLGTVPRLERTPPLKVSLIALPQQPKNVQPEQISDKPLSRPRQQNPQPVTQKRQVAPRSVALPAETETRPETQPEKRTREHEPPALVVATERIIEPSSATSSSKSADEIFITRTDKLATQPHAQAAIMEQLKQNYAEQIRTRINRVKHYPLMARKRGREGVVTLEFSIDMQGKLLDSKILLSSGTKSLDQSALNALASAAPFDPPPVELKTRQTFQLQILFTLRD